MFHFSLSSRLYCRNSDSSSTGKFLCPFHALIYFCLVITKIIQMVNTLRLECISRASLVAQMVKNLPAVLETWVQFLGQEDPLEKGMAPWHLDQERGSVRMQAPLWGSPWEAGWTGGRDRAPGRSPPPSGARAQGGPPARAESSQGDRAGLAHTGR